MRYIKSKKIAILLRDLTQLGGGERDVIVLIKGLNDYGIRPDLFCEKFPKSSDLYKMFHKTVSYNPINIKKPIFIKMIYEVFWNPLTLKLKKYNYIIDFTNKPPLLNASNYVKNIYTLNDTRSYTSFSYKSLKTFYQFLSLLGFRKFNFIQSKVITVTHSEFIQSEIIKSNGITLPIIYPPVDIKYFYSNSQNRLNNIVTIGRFSFEKNHIDQLKIAKKLKNINFYIVGAYNSESISYLKHLKEFVIKNNLTNVNFLTNLPLIDLKKLLSVSKFFLHTTKEEHFGISTVEAIAAGCLPIVHNSGGQIEIVSENKFRFNNIDQAVTLIKNISKYSPIKVNEQRTQLQKNIQKYNETNFINGFLKIINIFK